MDCGSSFRRNRQRHDTIPCPEDRVRANNREHNSSLFVILRGWLTLTPHTSHHQHHSPSPDIDFIIRLPPTLPPPITVLDHHPVVNSKIFALSEFYPMAIGAPVDCDIIK